jgi:hypothetical protein
MSIEMIRNPLVETVDSSIFVDATPEITNIHYDLFLLRITLEFKETDNPVYLTFDGIRGFRVLDEGDLLEFWNPETRTKGWLWQVRKGGWFDLECIRSGFISGITGGYKEFLILGVNECISVISFDNPIIFTPQSLNVLT